MSDENKKEKKKWSKKKKITVIVLSVVLALIAIVLIGTAVALHLYCQTEDYTVVETSEDVTLVAHRGMRSVAPENTVPSFEEAGKHGYTAAECDVYRTADGVWVVSHDSNTYRMMDKTAWIENKTLDELNEMTVDNGVNIDKYSNLKICTLSDYLKVCYQYKMTPVIELKGKNNTEYYKEIVDLADQYYLEPIYISFYIENLEKMRNLTSAKEYYLVKTIKEDDIEKANEIVNCGIDFNGNREENRESEILTKCRDEGLDLAAWTINDEAVLKELVENGVTLITTDSITYPRESSSADSK